LSHSIRQGGDVFPSAARKAILKVRNAQHPIERAHTDHEPTFSSYSSKIPSTAWLAPQPEAQADLLAPGETDFVTPKGAALGSRLGNLSNRNRVVLR
jgi:hypothetical protein